MEYKPLASAPAPKPMGAVVGAVIGVCVGAVVLAVVVAMDSTTLYALVATAGPAVGGMAAMHARSSGSNKEENDCRRCA